MKKKERESVVKYAHGKRAREQELRGGGHYTLSQ